MLRLIVIGFAVLGLLARASWARFSRRARGSLPQHVRRTLERLGPPFVKLGQALSLRRDLLPDDIVAALQGLQDHVAAFPGADARSEIERELARPIEEVFSEFDQTPFAAASIAQVHRARLRDGREVIIKVRRPGIRREIDRDMRLLVSVLRVCGLVVPTVKKYDAVSLAHEIWTRMQIETDLHQEALNVRRFVEGLRDQLTVLVPDVEEALCTEAVLVQAFSHGRRIDDPVLRSEGPRLARALVDLYLHQFFVMGVFHGDPHPGNLFVLADGRLCFHDFGVVGQLTPPLRRRLATFILALSNQDGEWLFDAASDLGVLSPSVNRRFARESIGAILAEYAGRPLSDWSLGDILVRIMRLGRGAGVALPTNLAILARAALLVEQVLRQLDRSLTVIDALAHADRQWLKRLFVARPDRGALLRLKSEAATAARQLPRLAAQWLYRAQRNGGHIPISLRIDTLHTASRRLGRSTDRLALALVTLGLYVAASLLTQHSVGPRIFGAFPLFGAIGYGLALWLTLRIMKGIAAAERDVGAEDRSS
jgi:ubiquinone biosynthesis protein